MDPNERLQYPVSSEEELLLEIGKVSIANFSIGKVTKILMRSFIFLNCQGFYFDSETFNVVITSKFKLCNVVFTSTELFNEISNISVLSSTKH